MISKHSPLSLYSNAHLGSFNKLSHYLLNIICNSFDPITIENPINNQIMFIRLKNFLCIKPTYFLNKIKREVLLFPSISRELFLKYYSRMFLKLVIFERKHLIEKKKLKKKIFPIMIKSNRCNLTLEYFNKLKYFRDEVDFEGGYFIYNGIEKVIRTTVTIKQNYFFFLKKSRNLHKNESNEFLMLKWTLKENREILILKSSYYFVNLVTVILKFYQEEIILFADILLIFFQFNPYESLINSLIAPNISITDWYNTSIYIKMAYNFSINHLIIKNNLKIFSRSECLRFICFCLTNNTNKCLWIGKETSGFRYIKKNFLDKIMTFKNNFFFIINMLNNLIINVAILMIQRIEKNTTDNLNLFNNMETILSGDLCCSVMISTLKETYIRIINNYNTSIEDNNVDFLQNNYYEKIKKYTGLNKIFKKLKTLISIGSILMFTKHESQDFGNAVVLQRFNKISFLSDLDLVHRGMYYRKQTDLTPRKIFLESFGFICPVNTPDGVLCGLLNHFCIGTKIVPVHCFDVIEFNFFKKEVLSGINILKANALIITSTLEKYTFFVKNTTIMGIINKSCKNILIRYFYKMRSLKIRQNINSSNPVAYFTLINRKLVYDEVFTCSYDQEFDCIIYCYDQSNRIMRLLKQKNNCSFHLIGCSEQLHIKIDWLLLNKVQKHESFYSHEDVLSGSLVSFTASLFPFSHHNQSTRNIYQCKMSKQAIGFQNNAYIFRRDSKLHFLISNQLPLINTESMLMYNFDLFPFGANTLISICSNTGLDMEDACVFKKSSQEFGLFHSVVNKNRIDTKKLEENITTIREPFSTLLRLNKKNKFFLPFNNNFLLLNGKKNSINIITRSLDQDHSIAFNSKLYKKEYNTFDYQYEYNSFLVTGTLQKTNHKLSKYTKVLFRKPNTGDKLSSRHGQKNVISVLYKNMDFPFEQKQGILPDLILNPHSFPSRMTIGMLREILLSRTCAIAGKISIVKSNSARDYGLNCVKENSFYLKSENNQKSGYDKLVDGKSGKVIGNEIFSGIVFYQKMQQMVKDKVQFRIFGKTNHFTKQPIGGRTYGGGIKIGEMEKDGLIAHGVSSVIIDRFLLSSDVSVMGYCLSCEKIINLEMMLEITKKNNVFSDFDLILEHDEIMKKIHNCPSRKVILIEIPHVLFYLLMELFTFSLMPIIFQI